MEDLRVPAEQASKIVDNIHAYLTSSPEDDESWEQMSLRLEAILGGFVRVLQDNGLPTPDVTLLVTTDNPYL